MKDAHMKDLRERLHMTQAQLAEALGISTRTVATYEAGTEPPKAIRLACCWLEHEATADAPACHGWDSTHCDEPAADASLEARLNAIEQRLLPEAVLAYAIDCHADWLARQTAPAKPSEAQLYEERLAAAERGARMALQRAQEACMAIEDAGLPIHQQTIPMTDEEAEEAEMKILKAQRLEEMQRAAPGALTDDEREEAEKARRAIAKARTLAAGEPWE